MNRQWENNRAADPPVRRRTGREWWAFTAIPMILALGFFAALFANYRQAAKNAEADIRTTLTDSAQSQAASLRTRIDAQYAILEATAAILSAKESLDFSETAPLLTAVRKATDFSFLSAIDRDGLCYYEDGTEQSVADRTYFQQSIAGKRSIEKIEQTRSDGRGRFILSVPILHNGTPLGVLACSYDEDRFRSLLVSAAYGQQGHSLVCDSSGNALILGYRSVDALSEADVAILCGDIPSQSGILTPRSKSGRAYYAVYEPLHIGDWTLIYAVPNSVMEDMVQQQTGASLVSLSIAMIAALLSFGALLIQERRNRIRFQVEHQLLRVREEEYRIATEQGNQFVYRFDLATKTAYFSPPAAKEIGSFATVPNVPEAFLDGDFVAEESKETVAAFFAALLSGQPKAEGDFRMKNRRGQYCWYHNEGTMIFSDSGKPLRAIISFLDVTRQREMTAAYESWRKSVNAMPPERYALFTYNLTGDRRIGFTGELLRDDPDAADMSFDQRTKLFSSRVYPEDRAAFVHLLTRRNILTRYRQGIRFTESEFRYADPGKPPRWFALTLRLVEEESSGDLTAFLLYEDVDARKREELALKAKSELDPLTGVLNRTALAERIAETLETKPDQPHVVVMIDLDDFKRINDTGGHALGDRVLITITRELRAGLRTGDCIGRIGGDEFMLFLQNLPLEEVVLRRAQQILETLSLPGEAALSVSGSLGIAIYPKDGASFRELYAAADAALYHAKALGKHTYVLYGPQVSQKAAPFTETPFDSGAAEAPAGPALPLQEKGGAE